jgi:MiaB/RimO family radical SAM methylthiotransferase
MRSARTFPFACLKLLQRNQNECYTPLKYWSRNHSSERVTEFRDRLSTGPALHQFTSDPGELSSLLHLDPDDKVYVAKRSSSHPYIDPKLLDGQQRKVYFETYGCQMNVNDTEIAVRILREHNYLIVNDIEEAQIVFLMTCAIREGAESKIWIRLKQLRRAKRAIGIDQIGLLGCMAERLKTRALEKEKLLDIVAGPDSYRDLPKLLAINNSTGQNAVNVLLSMDETYADVMPSVVDAKSKTSAYVSIMRGCENMCSYCIVPFTRGKERSRPLDSILREVDSLQSNGVREIILLGQNVNSYRDKSCESESTVSLSKGFKTIYKPKTGGLTFDILLDKVAQVNPEVRIRFTSPHPKDFPDQVLEVINRHPNICKNLHLPAQSGSDQVSQISLFFCLTFISDSCLFSLSLFGLPVS